MKWGYVPYPHTLLNSLLQVSLNFGFSFRHCGGIIINRYWVLTVAHCGLEPDLIVEVAAHKLSYMSENTYHFVSQAVRHPEFDEYTLDNDIALVRVDFPFTFTVDVKPICPPEADNLYIDEKGVVSGWGQTSEGKS